LKNKGFTLLEVMVAISIMAIVLVTVFKMHIQTLSMNTAVRFHTTAPLLAQKKIGELEIDSSIDQLADSGDFGAKFLGYTWKASVDEVQSDILEEDAESLKKVEIAVSFNNDELVYRLRAYRFIQD
jgi:general secretion pathway protein I